MTGRTPIEIEYPEGDDKSVAMHDGSVIRFHKLASDHDWRDKSAALAVLERHRVEGEIVTGLIYLNDEAIDLHQRLRTTPKPLNALTEPDLCPGSKALEAINASLR
jgi:2-oxoglutarate/2-oxoacid ferredoxin oxidoreductase subunit beta